jgi:hypothetical protein
MCLLLQDTFCFSWFFICYTLFMSHEWMIWLFVLILCVQITKNDMTSKISINYAINIYNANKWWNDTEAKCFGKITHFWMSLLGTTISIKCRSWEPWQNLNWCHGSQSRYLFKFRTNKSTGSLNRSTGS